MTRESALELRLRKIVLLAGGRCIKLPAFWYRGIPDRLVLLPRGRVFFIEMKRAKARTSSKVAPGQNAWKEYFLKYGFNFARIAGREELEEFVHEHIENAV